MTQKVSPDGEKKQVVESNTMLQVNAEKLQDIQRRLAGKKGVEPVLMVKNEEGLTVSVHGKRIGRPKKLEIAKLSKTAIREIYNVAFDRNAPELLNILFELAKTDKDLMKFVIEQRIGKAAQVVTGDEQAPLTVIVRRGLDEG